MAKRGMVPASASRGEAHRDGRDLWWVSDAPRCSNGPQKVRLDRCRGRRRIIRTDSRVAPFCLIDRRIREVTSRAHASLHAMESLHAGYKARRRFTGSRQGFLDDLAADAGQAMV